MSEDLFMKLEAVKDEATFLSFVEALASERALLEASPTTPDGFQGEWANGTISQFLEAATSWAKDSSFGILPGPRPENSWQLFAQFLWAGRGYE